MAGRKRNATLASIVDSDVEDIQDNNSDSKQASGPAAKDQAPAKKKLGRPRVTRSKGIALDDTLKEAGDAEIAEQAHNATEKKGRGGGRKAPKRQAVEQKAGNEVSATSYPQESIDLPSEDELVSSPRLVTKPAQPIQPSKTINGLTPKRDVEVASDGEFEYTPVVERQSKLESKTRGKAGKQPATRKGRIQSKTKTSDTVIPETQADITLLDEPELDLREMQAPTVNGSRPQQRRNVGSASETEHLGSDPALRRKLGDMTRKYENLDLRYRNLHEVGIVDANANMEKLRKQSEAATRGENFPAVVH